MGEKSGEEEVAGLDKDGHAHWCTFQSKNFDVLACTIWLKGRTGSRGD